MATVNHDIIALKSIFFLYPNRYPKTKAQYLLPKAHHLMVQGRFQPHLRKRTTQVIRRIRPRLRRPLEVSGHHWRNVDQPSILSDGLEVLVSAIVILQLLPNQSENLASRLHLHLEPQTSAWSKSMALGRVRFWWNLCLMIPSKLSEIYWPTSSRMSSSNITPTLPLILPLRIHSFCSRDFQERCSTMTPKVWEILDLCRMVFYIWSRARKRNEELHHSSFFLECK